MNAKGPGPRRLYDWTLKHECRQWDQGQQLTLKRDSVGQGCPVYIRMRKLVDEDRVEVEYYWEHNHSTEPKARSVFPLGPNELHWVRRMIQEGHEWKAIKKKLHPDEEHLQRLENEELATPPGFYIKYNDVRSGLYRTRMAASQKSRNVVESVTLWIQDIKTK
ncbi:hypothetical protein Unana1_00391 [Umbelopsis nana]